MTLQANVSEGVHRVSDAFTNFYLVEDGGRLTVVDACVPAAWETLQDALRELGKGLGDISAVVLTHAHFDHIGFAERLRRQLGVPVWVHENDVPLTQHPLRYGRERSPLRYVATKPKALPIIATFVRKRAFWPPPVTEVRRFTDGRLDVPGTPEVVFTPGHTLGHCALLLRDRDTLLAGDAVVTLNPYTGGTGPQIVARAATADSERALRSLDAIASTGVRTVLPGHGDPWTGGAETIAAEARAAGVP